MKVSTHSVCSALSTHWRTCPTYSFHGNLPSIFCILLPRLRSHVCLLKAKVKRRTLSLFLAASCVWHCQYRQTVAEDETRLQVPEPSHLFQHIHGQLRSLGLQMPKFALLYRSTLNMPLKLHLLSSAVPVQPEHCVGDWGTRKTPIICLNVCKLLPFTVCISYISMPLGDQFQPDITLQRLKYSGSESPIHSN